MKWWRLKEEISGVEVRAESNGTSLVLWVWCGPIQRFRVWWRWSFWGHGWLVPTAQEMLAEREFDD
jgi:hypothetical protein